MKSVDTRINHQLWENIHSDRQENRQISQQVDPCMWGTFSLQRINSYHGGFIYHWNSILHYFYQGTSNNDTQINWIVVRTSMSLPQNFLGKALRCPVTHNRALQSTTFVTSGQQEYTSAHIWIGERPLHNVLLFRTPQGIKQQSYTLGNNISGQGPWDFG